jgi:hypothetical protein
MKLVNVYPEGLVVRTLAYKREADCFQMSDRRQIVRLPKSASKPLTKPAEAVFAKTHYDCVPPHPFVDDPALKARRSELFKNALDSVGRDVLLPNR